MQPAYRPWLKHDVKDRPILLLCRIIVVLRIKILELVKFVNLLVESLQTCGFVPLCSRNRMHVQSSHHLVARLVIKEGLILYPIMDLEVAMIWVQLNEEWARSFALVGQTIRDKELTTVSSKDSLVLLFRFLSLTHKFLVTLLTTCLGALASILTQSKLLCDIKEFVNILSTLCMNLLHKEIASCVPIKMMSELMSMQIAFLVKPF